MDKDVIHTYNGLLLSHKRVKYKKKKERNNAIRSNMDATTDYRTK